MNVFRTLFIFLLVSAALTGRAQRVISFAGAAEQNIRTGRLDSLYRPALGNDSTVCVFFSQQEQFAKAYAGMLQEIGKYLYAHGFIWESPVRGFNRVYFNPSGRVDIFLYSIRTGQISAEKEKEFGKLLQEFVTGYTFPMKAGTPFSQCSPVTWMPKQ